MGLTLKKFAIGFVELPATIFSGITSLVFGYTEKKEGKGSAKASPKNQDSLISEGLLGLLLNGIKAIGKGIADFIDDHKTAIAIAFWSSLIIGGGVALTLFLWPAALTAVAGFSIYGLSIAGIAGANALLQIGLAGGLAFAATSLATYLVSGIVNFFLWLKDACSPPAPGSSSDEELHSSVEIDKPTNLDEPTNNATMHQGLKVDLDKKSASNEEKLLPPPQNTGNPLETPKVVTADHQEPIDTAMQTTLQ
jgi:lipid-A-disaccharide synthase-like uncharacterized protein